MMLASLFPAIRLPHGQHVDLDWPAFVEQYLTRHDIRRQKDGRLFSFAVYRGNPERADSNVRAVTGIVIDFDNSEGRGNDAQCTASPSLPEHHFENLGDLTYAWYSTHSHTAAWPKWRLVLPLDREVLPHEWAAVHDGAMALLGRDENIDATCGELSRAYYTPSCAPGNEDAAFAGFHDGRMCTVDELLSMTSVIIGENVHALPGASNRNQGRNDRLKSIASAMLGRGEPVESIVLELVRADNEHNPPLFSDWSEGYKGTAEAGALKFLGNIALSQSARSVQARATPDAISLRAVGQAHVIPPRDPNAEPLLTLVGDMTRTLQPPLWLVRHYLEQQALSVLFGEPGAGKSFIALDLALSIATGRLWHGQKVTQAPVIYICGEGYTGLQRRAWAWKDWHEVDLTHVPCAITRRAVPLTDARAIQVLQDDIDRIVDAWGVAPRQFFVDTLARNFGLGDENNTKDMGAYVYAEAMHLMDRYKAGCMNTHHTGHGDKQRARGSSSLKGAVDAEYFVSRQPDGTVEIASLKMKDAPEPAPLRFSLRSVDLPITDDGEPVTSLVPVAITGTAAPLLAQGRRGLGDVQRACLDVLVRLYAESRANLIAGGYDPLRARVSVKEWQAQAIKDGIVSDRKRFYERRESLAAAGLVRVENGFSYVNSEGGADEKTS